MPGEKRYPSGPGLPKLILLRSKTAAEGERFALSTSWQGEDLHA